MAIAGCRIDDRAPQEQPLPVLSGSGVAAAKRVEGVSVRPPAPPPHSAPAKESSLQIGPDRVLGLDRQAVKALLGEPGFVRRENPMELWRYRHEGCAVALFLYAEEADGRGAFRVRHIEAWAPGAEEISPRACLSALARRTGQSPTS